MNEHDPSTYYHCDCLDEGTEHDDRYYHCSCIEDGYSEDDDGNGD